MRRAPLHWILPVLLAVGLYAVTVGGTYVYDDIETARLDERLHDPHRWGEYLTQGYFPGAADNLWRPLVSLTYAVEAWGHGDRPWAFHLVNVLLHGVASGMVAALGGRLVGRRVGLLAGLLFAAHPVHVEAVAGIVGRAEEMALIGILGAALTFIGRPMTTRRALGVTGWFLFAAFSKEQGLLVPLMLLAWAGVRRWHCVGAPYAAVAGSVATIDYAGPGAKPEPTAEQKAERLLVALLMILTAAYVSYRNHILPWFWDRNFLDPAINPLVRSPVLDRWLIPVAILGRYAALLVAPYRLSIDYGMSVFTPRLNWQEPYFYIGVVVIAAAVAALVIAWRTRNAVAVFCLIALGLTYGMVSNVIVIGTIFGERLMYVPSAFACVLAAMALAKLSNRWLVGVIGVVLALGSVRTVTYAWEWNDRLRLYGYAVRAQPKASMPYLLLSGELSYLKDFKAADAVLTPAREVAPEAYQVWARSAMAKLELGELEEADAFAHRSFKLRPGNGEALGVMGRIGEARAKRRAATAPATTRMTAPAAR